MTNQTNPGPNESSAEARLSQVTDSLDGYAENLGLPKTLAGTVENEVGRLLDMAPEVLWKLSGTECGEAAFLLTRFAMHLQNAVNREQARVRWSEESVKKIIAPTVGQQKGYSYEERKMAAIRENDAATKIESLRVKAQLRIDRISYLSAKVESLAKALISLQQSKRGRND